MVVEMVVEMVAEMIVEMVAEMVVEMAVDCFPQMKLLVHQHHVYLLEHLIRMEYNQEPVQHLRLVLDRLVLQHLSKQWRLS